MNGLIFSQLKKYVVQYNGEELWQKALEEVELPQNQIFYMLVSYPDAQFYDLSIAIVKMTDQSLETFFESFGEFLSSYLLETYSKVINPKWRTFDFLENVDLYLRRVFGLTEEQEHVVKIEKKPPDELIIHFSCHQKLCWVFVGLIRGVARFYKEDISILNIQCLVTSGPACKIHVLRVP